MAISDKERRAVAARMREIMLLYPNAFLDSAVAQSILDVMGEGVTIGETVANLIDRPTTTLTEDEDGRTCCANCGCTALYMSDATYCPDCGAEVVKGV